MINVKATGKKWNGKAWSTLSVFIASQVQVISI